MPTRISQRRVQVTITLPAYLLQAVDRLSQETDLNRSDVIEEFVDYCFEHPEIVDEVFPYEESEDDSETDETEQNGEE